MALSTLLPVSEGEIYFEDHPFRTQIDSNFDGKFGMVLQDPLLLDTSVSENIGTGMRFRGIKNRLFRKKWRLRAKILNVHIFKPEIKKTFRW